MKFLMRISKPGKTLWHYVTTAGPLAADCIRATAIFILAMFCQSVWFPMSALHRPLPANAHTIDFRTQVRLAADMVVLTIKWHTYTHARTSLHPHCFPVTMLTKWEAGQSSSASYTGVVAAALVPSWRLTQQPTHHPLWLSTSPNSLCLFCCSHYVVILWG